MSGTIWDTINPNTTSGTQLAAILDDFKNAVVSGFIGTSRPTNLQAGGYWIDNTDDATGYWSFKLYTGSSDIEMWKINKVTGEMTLSSAEGEFVIVKTSDDVLGPILKLQKKRTAGGGQSLIGDSLGEIEFQSTDTGSISYVSAKIKCVSTDDSTAAEHGSYLSLMVVPTDGSALAEKLRINGDGTVSIGTPTAENSLHVVSTDSKSGIKTELIKEDAAGTKVILKKKRVAANGQVLSGDSIGENLFVGVDQNGSEVELAKIEVKSTQDISDVNNGSELLISVKNTDTNTFQEAIKIKDGLVYHYGIANTNANSNAVLLDDSVTRNLLSVDGSVYGSFTAEIYITGRDNNPETRQQKLLISGVYDYNNTTWTYEVESNIMKGSGKVVELSFTDAETLVIDYVNQFVAAEFTDGTIYTQLRRNLR